MGELLTKFISLLDDETEDKVTLASLMEEEDRVDWEILVEAMDQIDIMKIMSYVKMLELMLKRAKATPEFTSMLGMMGNNTPTSQKHEPYDGSMFG